MVETVKVGLHEQIMSSGAELCLFFVMSCSLLQLCNACFSSAPLHLRQLLNASSTQILQLCSACVSFAPLVFTQADASCLCSASAPLEIRCSSENLKLKRAEIDFETSVFWCLATEVTTTTTSLFVKHHHILCTNKLMKSLT